MRRVRRKQKPPPMHTLRKALMHFIRTDIRDLVLSRFGMPREQRLVFHRLARHKLLIREACLLAV